MAAEGQQNWRSFAVPVFDGQFDTRVNTEEDYQARTLGELWGMAPASRPKRRAPAFLPSLYRAPDARCHAVQQAQGQFVALTADIDKGDVAAETMARLADELFGQDVARFVYSTSSSTPVERRWRLLIPLATPVRYLDWRDGQLALVNFFERHGVHLDRALLRAGQPVFLPNVPPERRDEHGAPVYFNAFLAGERGLPL
jgi:hypothetical protein